MTGTTDRILPFVRRFKVEKLFKSARVPPKNSRQNGVCSNRPGYLQLLGCQFSFQTPVLQITGRKLKKEAPLLVLSGAKIVIKTISTILLFVER